MKYLKKKVLFAILAFTLLFISACSGIPNYHIACLSSEGTTLHTHPYLQIFIDGEKVKIPSGIGIPKTKFQGEFAVSGACFLPIHTHDSSGIIHVESPTLDKEYTLEDFFKVWKVQLKTIKINGQDMPITFSKDEILGFKADSTHKITLLVDGKSNTEYEKLILNYLDYCNNSDKTNQTSPCYGTAPSNPTPAQYVTQYGTRHTIIIKYEKI